jgi:hypothetical protein
MPVQRSSWAIDSPEAGHITRERGRAYGGGFCRDEAEDITLHQR